MRLQFRDLPPNYLSCIYYFFNVHALGLDMHIFKMLSQIILTWTYRHLKCHLKYFQKKAWTAMRTKLPPLRSWPVGLLLHLLHALSLLVLAAAVWGGHYHPHFTDENAEVQKRQLHQLREDFEHLPILFVYKLNILNNKCQWLFLACFPSKPLLSMRLSPCQKGFCWPQRFLETSHPTPIFTVSQMMRGYCILFIQSQ